MEFISEASRSADQSKPDQEGDNRPELSVLMPVYNNLLFLGEAVESILSQSFAGFEFIIVDDGSDDGSAQMLAGYAAADTRIRLYRNEGNRGIVFSLNRGLEKCRGKYIVRMDSDDIALSERLKLQFDFMEEHPEIVVSCSALRYIDAQDRDLGVVRKAETGESLLAANPLFHPASIIRRESLLSHDFHYLEEFCYAEDYFLWLQLSGVGKLGSQDEVLLKYRMSSGASRIRNLKRMLMATLRVKLAGVFRLGIRPTCGDVARFMAETFLLLLPASLVLGLYNKITFGRKVKLNPK